MSQASEMDGALCRAAAAAISDNRSRLADALVALEFERRPELDARFGSKGRDKSRRDAEYHLDCLAEAVRLDSPLIFAEYIAWAKVALASRGVDSQVLAAHLRCMCDVIVHTFSAPVSNTACAVIERALDALPLSPGEPSSFLDSPHRYARLARAYLDALLHWRRGRASELIFAAVDNGVTIEDLYLHVFQCSQYEVGRLWQLNRITVAQEHYCSAATQFIMAQLYPRVFDSRKHGGTMVATAITGEMHEIGVRMVADMFELRGWSTHYLGANVPEESVVRTVADRRADVLGISATLVAHIGAVEKLMVAVRSSPAGRDIKILVGGYAFNLEPSLWHKLGADGHAKDLLAASALSERMAKVRISRV